MRLALEYDATQCNIEWEDWVEEQQQEQEGPEPVERAEPEPVEQEQDEKDWLMGHFNFARAPVTPERVEQEQEENAILVWIDLETRRWLTRPTRRCSM